MKLVLSILGTLVVASLPAKGAPPFSLSIGGATPTHKDGGIDLTYLDSPISSVRQEVTLKPGDKFHDLIFESADLSSKTGPTIVFRKAVPLGDEIHDLISEAADASHKTKQDETVPLLIKLSRDDSVPKAIVYRLDGYFGVHQKAEQ